MPYPYYIDIVNKKAAGDPEGFARECEAIFNRKVAETAATIAEKAEATGSHVVLLSGPSGSGKTTTAQKIRDALKRIGVHAQTISLDKYFVTPRLDSSPLTADGEYDRESPYCLDLELLNAHFHALERGEEVLIPHFDFAVQARDPSITMPLKLGRNEMVIFEGIHALNDLVADEHPDAFKLYISARSDVKNYGRLCFKRTWTRLMRRVVRDDLFRGTGVAETLKMWANVRQGEKMYISPFKYKADILFDSSMEYEVPVMKQFALRALGAVPDDVERLDELSALLPSLREFEDVDASFVPEDSILREFIGGGIYEH